MPSLYVFYVVLIQFSLAKAAELGSEPRHPKHGGVTFSSLFQRRNGEMYEEYEAKEERANKVKI
jgi:hypothetical protein